MQLPPPRGPLSTALLEGLAEGPGALEAPTPHADDPLIDEDLQLSLYLCYEMGYRGLPGVDDRWEWDPSFVAFRGSLERLFEEALRTAVPDVEDGRPIPEQLKDLVKKDSGPSLSTYVEREATIEQFREFVVHRSAYHLKEADPHSWAIPRLSGRTKAAFLEIQNDEYGGGNWRRMHSELFASMMTSIGLDAIYGAYLAEIPAVTLATVNLMSLFGVHRRLRGCVVGHLALFEMTSTTPNRRYGNGLRRLDPRADTRFFDEHVEADAVHEQIAAYDLAGSLTQEDPRMASDIMFGASALFHLDALMGKHLLESWDAGRSSLARTPSPLTA